MRYRYLKKTHNLLNVWGCMTLLANRMQTCMTPIVGKSVARHFSANIKVSLPFSQLEVDCIIYLRWRWGSSGYK